MSTAVTLSSKGQVTIPKAIRDQLALKAGDRIVFAVRGEQVVVEPVGRLMDWYNSAGDELPSGSSSDVRERVRAAIGRETAAEGIPVTDEGTTTASP